MIAHRTLKMTVLAVSVVVACLPWAGGGQAQAQLPHLRCYVITPGTALNVTQTLTDQFFSEDLVTLKAPHVLCTPVENLPVGDATQDHLKCYQTVPAGPPANAPVIVTDDFGGEESLTVRTPHFLCVPASKTAQ
jgi:hypothetical protein